MYKYVFLQTFTSIQMNQDVIHSHVSNDYIRFIIVQKIPQCIPGALKYVLRPEV